MPGQEEREPLLASAAASERVDGVANVSDRDPGRFGRRAPHPGQHDLLVRVVLGLISSESNDRVTQIKAGQVYQRLSLLAASEGIWYQPMSQIVQIEETKSDVAKLQPNPSLYPQHPFWLGFAAPEKHRTPRRNVEEVLI